MPCHAIGGYIGGQGILLLNLRDALTMAREIENESNFDRDT